jgi:hypothetical protein
MVARRCEDRIHDANFSDGTDDIWTVNPDGTNAEKLTSSSAIDCCGSW